MHIFTVAPVAPIKMWGSRLPGPKCYWLHYNKFLNKILNSFSSTLVSIINKTDRHDKTEILLQVTLTLETNNSTVYRQRWWCNG